MTSTLLFRRKREEGGADAPLTLGSLRRMSARFPQSVAAPIPDLTWRPLQSFEAKLSPYRDVRVPAPGAGKTLLRLQPMHRDESHFYFETDRNPNWRNQILIIDNAGNAIKPDDVGDFAFPWDST